MSKHEGVKTVVFGGKKDTPQQYCGIVGGQSTDFSTIDTEIKVCTLDLTRHVILTRDFGTSDYSPKKPHSCPTWPVRSRLSSAFVSGYISCSFLLFFLIWSRLITCDLAKSGITHISFSAASSNSYCWDANIKLSICFVVADWSMEFRVLPGDSASALLTLLNLKVSIPIPVTDGPGA